MRAPAVVQAQAGGLWLGRRVPPHRLVLVTEEGTVSLGPKREKFGAFLHVRVDNLDMGDLPSENWDDRLRVIRDVAEEFGAQAVCCTRCSRSPCATTRTTPPRCGRCSTACATSRAPASHE
jgi:hypothetical protein